ncbi:10-hydroxy-9-(phosphonooxy)octadecanoate phosphatase [Aureococcus anophagefferens]|nr:10-hydroxy-9-(phosphonooxy)octadecanoate phosphatase [Aureococcus anophagefferens]
MDDYVKDWARAGSVGRCGSDHCDWMKDFGAIDVGCTFDVGRIGLNVRDGGRGPAVFTFGDGTTFDGAPALLMVANGPYYLFRLWPLFLNKLLYASDAGLRPFIWLGELPPTLEEATAPRCLDSKPGKARREKLATQKAARDAERLAKMSARCRAGDSETFWYDNNMGLYEKKPTPAPTTTPTATRCEDDDDWLYDGKDGRGCAWIAEKTFRCDGKDGAREACPATCGECEPACEDDETWFSKKSSNNCRWVAEKPDSRCSRKSDDKVKAKDACPVACGTCV